MINQIISRELAESWCKNASEVYLVGSRKYNLHSIDSDYDHVLVIEDSPILANNITYQYTNETNDYLIVTRTRFNTAREDGSDVVLFEAKPEKITKQIIRAYLGLAKRDWKEWLKTSNTKKKYHAIRCCFIAKYMLKENKIELEVSAKYARNLLEDINNLDRLYNELRKELNSL